MAKKEKKKEQDYYTMKIPNSLRGLFQKYIEHFPSLGFNFPSQYAQFILQKEGERILKDHPEIWKKEEKKASKDT